jgi:hypothetical protein
VQRWEYLVVRIGLSDRGVPRPQQINGRDVHDWRQAQPIYELLEKLGDEGWELTSTESAASGNWLQHLIFKRPKDRLPDGGPECA